MSNNLEKYEFEMTPVILISPPGFTTLNISVLTGLKVGLSIITKDKKLSGIPYLYKL